MIVYYIYLNVLMRNSIDSLLIVTGSVFVDFSRILNWLDIQIWILMTDEHKYCYLIECLLQQCYDGDDDDDNADYFIERGK